jgi:formyl-CoA transferase
MLLADYGADVIKVEPPKGDLWRRLPDTPPDSRLALAHMGPSFVMINRNKRSIVLDITLKQAQEVFRRLVEGSDILIENLRPGEMEKVGLGYEALKDLNPRLIYASASAYGHEGPEATSRGFDYLAQARAGILAARRYPDGTPVSPSVYLADLSCAMMLAYAVVLCVLEREKSGRGQKIEASLLGAAIAVNPTPLVRVSADPPARPPPNALNCPYKCADGRYVFLSSPVPHYWRAICQAVGLPHLVEDKAFATPASRLDNAEMLHSILANVFSSRPSREWVRTFEDAGVPCALVQEPDEVYDDPQVRANLFMIEHAHPALGPVKMPGLSFRLSRTAGEVRFGAPLLGEHTRAILQDLGYSEPAIRELEQQGVTRATT